MKRRVLDNSKCRLFPLILILIISSCNITSNPIENNQTIQIDQELIGDVISWEKNIKTILNNNCASSCHGKGSSLGDWTDYAIVKTAMLSPINKKNIMFRIKDGSMPQGNKLDKKLIQALEKWIAGGMQEVSTGPTPSPSVPSDPVPNDPVPNDPVPSDPVPNDPPEFDVENVVKTQCLSCHRSNTGQFPFIDGNAKGYLKKELLHFKNDRRLDKTSFYMNSIMKQFSDVEISKMANYIKKQDRCQNKITVDPLQGDIENGKAIFEVNCLSCHTRGSRSFSTPYLQGQGTKYLKDTMLTFIAEQDARPSTVMNTMLSGLDEQIIEDIAAYLNSESICE